MAGTTRQLNALLLLFLLLTLSIPSFATVAFHIQLIGIQGNSLHNANARLGILLKNSPTPHHRDSAKALSQQGAHEIEIALQPYGYYKPIIHSQLTYRQHAWYATYHIQPGPAIFITQLTLQITGEGTHQDAIQRAARSLPIKQGDILTTRNYDAAKEKLFAACQEAGYLKANFEKSQILITLNPYQAKVALHLATGQRYYFGNTRFTDSPYALPFLTRFLNYRPGEPFSSQTLITLQQDMSDSFYFSQVDITPEFQDSHHDTVPITIETTPPKSERYSIGLGYGTFTGPRLSSSINFRRLSDTGQHAEATLRLSSVLSALIAKYYIPGRNPLTSRWVMGANYEKFDPKSGNSESRSLLFGYLYKKYHLQAGLTLNYLQERYTVFQQKSRLRNLLYPNLNIGYTKTNDVTHPSHGYALNMMAQGASERLASATRFLQTDLKAKAMFSPLSFAKIITRAELGHTLVHNLYDLPLTMRFFAGGPQSIRGFADSSIGPGKYLQLGSIEYQNKLYDQLYGAIFYDIGAASNHIGSPINKGIGGGLVYYSIVGPAKLYLARAITKKTIPYAIEFSIGPEF